MSEEVDRTVRELEGGHLPAWISDHLQAYQASGGTEGHLWDAAAVGGEGQYPCLLLTTVGRRSGKTYTHPLIYGVDGERFVIVASKGGSDTQPAWYFNLLAAPDIVLQVGTDRFAARAALAQGAERARLWALMTSVYPPYADYQSKTTREIPIFALERVAG